MTDNTTRLKFELDISDIQAKLKGLEASAKNVSAAVSESIRANPITSQIPPNATGQQLGSFAARSQIEATKGLAQSLGITDPRAIREISKGFADVLRKELAPLVKSLDAQQQKQYSDVKSRGVRQGLAEFAPLPSQVKAPKAQPANPRVKQAQDKADNAKIKKAEGETAEANKPVVKATTPRVKPDDAATKKAKSDTLKDNLNKGADPQGTETDAQKKAAKRITDIQATQAILGRETTSWADLTKKTATEQADILRKLKDESARLNKIRTAQEELGRTPITTGDFEAKSAAEQNNILKGLRAETKRLDDTRAIQGRLGVTPITNEDFVAKTSIAQKELLEDLRDRQRIVDRDTKLREKAGDSIDSYARVVDAKPGDIYAQADAARRGTDAVIKGGGSQIISDDQVFPGLKDNIVLGRSITADLEDQLKASEATTRDTEESRRLTTERVAAEKIRAAKVKEDVANLTVGTPAGPDYGPGRAELKTIQDAEKKRQAQIDSRLSDEAKAHAERQRTNSQIESAYADRAKQEASTIAQGVAAGREAAKAQESFDKDNLRKNQDEAGKKRRLEAELNRDENRIRNAAISSIQLRGANLVANRNDPLTGVSTNRKDLEALPTNELLKIRTHLKGVENAYKQLEVAAKKDVAEAVRLAEEIGPARGRAVKQATARLEESQGKLTRADLEYIKSLSTPEINAFSSNLAPTQAELEAARKAGQTPFDKDADRERQALQRRAATILSEQYGTSASDEFRKLNGSSLESLRQYNVLLGRTNAEQAELRRQGAKQVEAKRKAAEAEAEAARKAAVTPFTRADDKEIDDLRTKIATRLNEQYGLDPNEEYRKRAGVPLQDLRNERLLVGPTAAEQAAQNEAARKATEARQKAATKAAEDARKANLTPFDRDAEKRRLELQRTAAVKLNEQYGTDTSAAYRSLSGKSLQELEQFNARLGRTNAEQQAYINEQIKLQAAAKKATDAQQKAADAIDPTKRSQKQLDSGDLRQQTRLAGGTAILDQEIADQRRKVQEELYRQSQVTREGQPGIAPGTSDITQQALAAVGAERLAAEQRLATLANRTAPYYQQMASLKNAERASTDRLVAAQRREAANSPALLRAHAERLVAEKEWAKAQRKMTSQVARESGVGGSNPISRLLGRFGGGGFGGGNSGNGGIPPTLGEFFGAGAANIARYAIPGAIGYGLLNGITGAIKEAEELERVFASVEAQFESSFGNDAKAKFTDFRSEILSIARDTGTAADELALIGLQLQGAFGQGSGVTIDGDSGTDLVTNQIRASAEISKVTGLSAAEITDSLTAISLGFDTTFRKVGDVTLNLQDRFGVLAKQIIPFLGDIAPVAQDAGFSLEEFATIAAITQQKSGRSGTALAEAYGRVIPAINEARGKLAELSLTNPNLGADFVETVNTKSIKDVFFAVANNFEDMNQGSRDFVINLLGGRREAAAILAAFNDSARLQSEIAKTSNPTVDGTLAARYEKISKTLTESLARLREQLMQLGVTLFEGGLGDALKTIVNTLDLLAEGLSLAFSAFGKFNDVLSGIPAKILLVAGALKLLNPVLGGSAAGAGVNFGITAAIARITSGKTAAATAVPGGIAAATRPGSPVRGLTTATSTAAGAAAVSPKAGFGATLALTAAATIAAYEYEYFKGLKQEIDEQRDDYEKLAVKELEKLLLADKDSNGNRIKPFSGGFGSDLKAFFKRGVAGLTGDAADADPRKLIEDEINRKRFKESGLLPQKTQALDGPAAVPSAVGFGVSQDVLFEAAENAKVIADTRAKVIANTNNLNEKEAEKLRKDLDKAKKLASTVNPGQNKAKEKVKELEAKLYGSSSTLVSGFIGEGEGSEEREQLAADLTSSNDKVVTAALDELIRRSETDIRFALFLFQLLGYENEGFTEFKARIAQEKAKSDALKDITTRGTEKAKSLAEIKDLFEQGDASIADYLEALTRQQAFVINQISDLKSVGGDASGYIKEEAELNKTISKLKSNSAKSTSDLLGEFNQISKGKGDTTDKSEVERLTKLIDSGALNPEDRLKAANEIISLLQGLDEATAVPPGVQKVLAERFFDPKNNETYAEFIKIYTLVFSQTAAGQLRDMVIAVALGKETTANVNAFLDQQIANATAVAAIGADEIAAAGGGGAAASGASAANLDRLKSIKGLIDLQLQSVAGKVPTEAASSKAGKDPQDLADQIAQAKQDYYKALIEGDPVKVAELAVQQADEDYARAKAGEEGEADRWKAMASKVRALRQLDAAKYDVTSAQSEYASALAAFRGNTLEVARLAVDDAVRERDRVNQLFETDGAGEADKLKAEVGLIQAKASARDAQLASQKDDYQFLYDMGQITKQQFIQYLQTLKQIPELTTEQLRALDREIKQLQGELGQDLQFNLPTKFKLPTVYEVRRIEQTGSSQAGYVDNRNVTIQINVNDGSGQQQMLQVLTDVMGAPARVSSGTKRY